MDLLGWPYGHTEPARPVDATSMVELTGAFMGMDVVLSQVDAAVADCRATGVGNLDDAWDEVRTQCYEASSAYLSLTAAQEPPVRVTAMQIDNGTALLREAIKRVEKFREQHVRPLNKAAAAVAAVKAAVQDAQNAAVRARTAYGSMEAHYRNYPSLVAAVERLDVESVALQAAGDYPAKVAATVRVLDAANLLAHALNQAPRMAEDAKNALSSISTRIAGARTRLEGVAPALSALLREFVAASSSDLVGSEGQARGCIDQAAEWFGEARSAQHRGDPGRALELAVQIRDHLKRADHLIDAVPSRLRVLHELRDDPTARSKKVRFELHDAQMFAVDHGITGKWAPVLDTQLQRIELLEKALGGVHPDYWAYATGLDHLSEFLDTIVARMGADVTAARR